jgi:hypothetical protein
MLNNIRYMNYESLLQNNNFPSLHLRTSPNMNVWISFSIGMLQAHFLFRSFGNKYGVVKYKLHNSYGISLAQSVHDLATDW